MTEEEKKNTNEKNGSVPTANDASSSSVSTEDTSKKGEDLKVSTEDTPKQELRKQQSNDDPKGGSEKNGKENRKNGKENGNANGRDTGDKKRKGLFRRSRRGRERPRSEFETKVLSARRVSRVTAGGRRFSLSVAVAVGNKKGKVGVAIGKGQDMASATEKARNRAQKHLTEIPITEDNGIANEAIGKYCASVVHIRPGKGFVVGGAVRAVAELAGIQHINAKIISRSKGHFNNARAALKAFSLIKK